MADTAGSLCFYYFMDQEASHTRRKATKKWNKWKSSRRCFFIIYFVDSSFPFPFRCARKDLRIFLFGFDRLWEEKKRRKTCPRLLRIHHVHTVGGTSLRSLKAGKCSHLWVWIFDDICSRSILTKYPCVWLGDKQWSSQRRPNVGRTLVIEFRE